MLPFPPEPVPPRELLGGESSAILYSNVISDEEQSHYFSRLHGSVPWEQRKVTVFGKEHDQPRLVAWYGDPGRSYTYSGLTLEPLPWSDILLRLRGLCEDLAEAKFNSALLNLYQHGQHTVGWHSDDEPQLGPSPVIASVSLGTPRRFGLRHKETRETVKIELPPGSVLVMSGRCQSDWAHQLPRTKRVSEPRINVTFRRMFDDG